MVVTLPSGANLVIDVGNDSRYPEVRNALTGPVEWYLITHDHEDHAGALDKFESRWESKGWDPTPIGAPGVWDLGDGVEQEQFLFRTHLGDVEVSMNRKGEPRSCRFPSLVPMMETAHPWQSHDGVVA